MRRFAVASPALLAGLIGSGCGDVAVCADGFEEQMGSCVPACADPCGDHEFCDGTPQGGACTCAPGYGGDPCEWVGVLKDPELTDPEIWFDTKNGATVLPLAEGFDDQLGLASFQSSVTCSAGSVGQTVEMPSYELAEPLVASVRYRFQEVNGVVVGYGGVYRPVVDAVLYPGWSTERICLGDAAYGGNVRFEIAAAERTPRCFSEPAGIIEVDRFDVVPAVEGECPEPGAVRDGNAEGDSGLWRFWVELNGEGESGADFAPGQGEEGSRGARIQRSSGSMKHARMATEISVPLQTTLPSPALRFWHRASSGSVHKAQLGAVPPFQSTIDPLDTIVGDGTARTFTYCLPPHTHGGAFELSFTTRGASGDGTELVVDNVEITSDSRCGTSSEVFDPSLDSAPNRWPGADIVYSSDSSRSESAIRVTNDSPRALPSGSGVLELSYADNKTDMTAHTWVRVPAPTADAGPILRFQANVPAEPGVDLFWAFGRGVDRPDCEGEPFCPSTPLSNTILAGGGWRDVPGVCLPPEWAGRWFRVRLALRPSEEQPLELYDPPRSILFDNFEVDTDPQCPGL
jgi:hypothetical protein